MVYQIRSIDKRRLKERKYILSDTELSNWHFAKAFSFV